MAENVAKERPAGQKGPKGVGTLTVEQIQEDRITQVSKQDFKNNNNKWSCKCKPLQYKTDIICHHNKSNKYVLKWIFKNKIWIQQTFFIVILQR